MPLTYYSLNNCKLTVAELWRVSKNPLEFVLAVILKLLRIKVSSAFGFAMTDRLVQVAPSALAERASAQLQPLTDEAASLGFENGFYFTLPTVGSILGYGGRLRSRDRVVMAQVNYLRAAQNNVVDERAMFSFSTKLNDGRWLTTSGFKREEDTPPEFVSEHFPGKPMREVLQRHYERLGSELVAHVAIANDDVLESMVLELETRTFEFNIARGLFEPLSADQVEELRTQTVNPVSVSDAQDLPRPRHQVRTLEWVSWFLLVFGIYLFMKGEAANQAQFLFRAATLGFGLFGVIVSLMLRIRGNAD